MTYNKQSTRYYSSKQEKRIAKDLGGRVVPNSGATPFKKGDVSTKHILIEAKTLLEPRKARTIKKKWLKDIEDEAFQERKSLSALAFDFGDGEDFFILNKRDFLSLYEAWVKELENSY